MSDEEVNLMDINIDNEDAALSRDDALHELEYLESQALRSDDATFDDQDLSMEFQDIEQQSSSFVDHEDGQTLLSKDPIDPASGPPASMFTIRYYQTYFNVTTTQIRGRLLRSMNPLKKFYHEEDRRPDMYGPFWIATTLIFVMGASGNLADYFVSSVEHWTYDFKKVTAAAFCLYMLISLIPLLAYFGLNKIETPKTLVEVISLYGYSLFPFLPSSLLCILPSEILRWAVTFGALILSVKFLLTNLWEKDRVQESKRQLGLLFVAAIVNVHFAFALYFKIYFFPPVQPRVE